MDTSCLCNFYGRGLFHQCRFNKVVRKEYRVMSDDERNRLEFVIREVDPTVALPYWDSTLDSSIPDPSKSVLWSDELMGSQDSDGQMRRGAFKGWYTSDHTRYFKRNIGAKGQLLIGSVVSNLINGGTLRDILSFTARSQVCDMEYIPISTNDPLFFNHHCMIDLIWEQWRQKHQTERERETSYPPDNEACSSSAHYGNVQMVPFYPFTNRDGLSNKYTDEQQCYGGVCHNGYCTKKSPEPKPTTPPRVNEVSEN
ncbi:hypothetical protein NECAME_00930 [Necator americanus]|uniref:Tyrosinase copper-binding domain-containing protein n=1 Tax=Necator americanus TaxID=51031 RepID=W2SQV6_NECAM|nr:hypothetical protein NECAME_00930 [Necator americanus]ETN71241.1 hypothetical protein NECAME_00930 [Necator americanus]